MPLGRFFRFVTCAIAVSIASPPAAEAATLQVAWDASPDPAVVGYRVLIGTRSGTYSAQLDAGTQTTQQISNLAAGVTYFFVVQAYDAAGNLSAPSAEVAGAAPSTSPLAVTCPAPTATSPNGAPVAVTFSILISGGAAPVSSSCAPTSGSLFPVGVTPVSCTAKDAVNANATCATTVLVSASSTPGSGVPPAPPPPVAIDMAGALSSLAGRCPSVTFRLSGKTVSTTRSTTYSWKSCSALSSGRQIQVKGTLQSNGSVVAQTIAIKR